MIIHPLESAPQFGTVVEGLNRRPSPGDDGHVDDHRTLVKVLFEVGSTAVPVAVAMKEGGEWSIMNMKSPYVPEPATFADVLALSGRAGLLAVASGAFADGETEWTEDSEVFDGAHISFNVGGLVGLPAAVLNIIEDASDLSDRISALEATAGG